MKSFVQDGNTLPMTMTADRLSGDVVIFGSMIGVMAVDALNTVVAEVSFVGVYDLKRDAADIFTEGLLVYWDDSAKQVTIDPTANTLLGAAVEAQAAAAGNIKVRLNGIAA